MLKLFSAISLFGFIGAICISYGFLCFGQISSIEFFIIGIIIYLLGLFFLFIQIFRKFFKQFKTFFDKETYMIKQFIRKSNRSKVGILVSYVDYNNEDNVIVGFSKCCTEDIFDNNIGTEMAIVRALRYKDRPLCEINIPESIKNDLIDFIDRSKRVFKNKIFPVWVEDFVKSSTKKTDLAEANV